MIDHPRVFAVLLAVAGLLVLLAATLRCGGEIVDVEPDAAPALGTYCEIPYSGWSKPGSCELGAPCTLVVNGMALDGECRP
jgi:hypothetical protein